jgi:hypothetical protein
MGQHYHKLAVLLLTAHKCEISVTVPETLALHLLALQYTAIIFVRVDLKFDSMLDTCSMQLGKYPLPLA